ETLPPPLSTPIATPRMVHRTPIIPPAVHPPHAIPHPGPISRSPEIVASVTATSTVGSYPHAPTAPPLAPQPASLALPNRPTWPNTADLTSPRSTTTHPIVHPTTASVPVFAPPASATTVRSQRGDYRVGPRVGAGAFGAVFECLGPFDQRYALKVLRPSGRPIERVREDWASEVRRLLQLRHPNVVYIHDAFEWEGSFCVALEWCDHTLHDMLEQPLQEELAIELSRQMLAAVQYLHDWDIVHDDLHPGNVLIQQADRPIVKLSDFGISAELRGAPTVRPEIVHHAIMAPELIAAGYTSKQSDLYQLGMMMYWMITGSPPLDRNIPYEMLVHQISEGVARQRAEQLATPFGNIVAKMLRRRDAYRYSSAREVWMDLRALPAWQARQIFRLR
ncbi:MAG TPA: protein kinase, partial [Polyangiaceae bacterium]|nr:protein kinase [Polyangiaceae bacterium]